MKFNKSFHIITFKILVTLVFFSCADNKSTERAVVVKEYNLPGVSYSIYDGEFGGKLGVITITNTNFATQVGNESDCLSYSSNGITGNFGRCVELGLVDPGAVQSIAWVPTGYSGGGKYYHLFSAVATSSSHYTLHQYCATHGSGCLNEIKMRAFPYSKRFDSDNCDPYVPEYNEVWFDDCDADEYGFNHPSGLTFADDGYLYTVESNTTTYLGKVYRINIGTDTSRPAGYIYSPVFTGPTWEEISGLTTVGDFMYFIEWRPHDLSGNAALQARIAKWRYKNGTPTQIGSDITFSHYNNQGIEYIDGYFYTTISKYALDGNADGDSGEVESKIVKYRITETASGEPLSAVIVDYFKTDSLKELEGLTKKDGNLVFATNRAIDNDSIWGIKIENDINSGVARLKLSSLSGLHYADGRDIRIGYTGSEQEVAYLIDDGPTSAVDGILSTPADYSDDYVYFFTENTTTAYQDLFINWGIDRQAPDFSSTDIDTIKTRSSLDGVVTLNLMQVY